MDEGCATDEAAPSFLKGLGSNDLERARDFYDATFITLETGPARWTPEAGHSGRVQLAGRSSLLK
jgi:hypothetical protein